MQTMLLFSDRRVSTSRISSNRLVLFHGPPGTGKTTLCKALAQKVFIRMSECYDSGQLIEVNSHSLFSKWFSESGKLVLKLFSTITALLQDPRSLTFILIDEVESLTATRQNALNGNDPSDALRVVNALLTQLDSITRYPNVLLLSTSNILDALDSAFIDRADIMQFIGKPSLEAIYNMLHSCVLELQQVHICAVKFPCMITLVCYQFLTVITYRKAVGLSGRSLKKLPVLAHSFCRKVCVLSLPH
ncbi:unnamed protein product [Soboliphyme baturini]|uniref:AAA domain-containing protein n=1 Tax=Soboliphyme baturini TaxID=241478 RepID=A0A183J486_9BILA|nr:unnamed protein product [Soboliphyme baturini]